jgi:hypothetical protein
MEAFFYFGFSIADFGLKVPSGLEPRIRNRKSEIENRKWQD